MPVYELTAANPEPGRLADLALWRDDDGRPYAASRFPDAPDFTCDSWCYESPLDLIDAGDAGGGALELVHRWQDNEKLCIRTRVTPEPGAVDVCAWIEAGPELGGAVPDPPLTPNLCWQLRRAPGFASQPDPYPQFVERCFIFTGAGLTFLHQTERRPIPVRPADHEYNNPPWVQMYSPRWQPCQRAGPDTWADYSPDRYAYPVIGCVSRDRRHLAALACRRPSALCQAWHDCMHNNPVWEPGPGGRMEWHLRMYVLENDPEELLRRLDRDFPDVPAVGEAASVPRPWPSPSIGPAAKDAHNESG